VTRIRNRFRRNYHNVPLLLYGPSGVGKRTVARLYAKALLCDTPRGDRSVPCDECSACRGFATTEGGSLDFHPVNAARHRDGRRIYELFDLVPFGPRRVVAIENLDAAAPDFVDALLKRIESEERPKENGTPSAPFTIIITARDLNDVREAGQSRCEIERLEPLLGADARELCARAVAANEIAFEQEDAFATFVIGSGGLPERIADACTAIRGADKASVRQVRRALKIDWGEPILRVWRDLLKGNRLDWSALQLELEDNSVAICSRFVLTEVLGVLRTGHSGGSGEPALRLPDEDLIRGVVMAVEDIARKGRLSPAGLVEKLSEVFDQDNFLKPTVFLNLNGPCEPF